MFAANTGSTPDQKTQAEGEALQEFVAAAPDQERHAEEHEVASRQQYVRDPEIHGQAEQQADRGEHQKCDRPSLVNSLAVRRPATAQTTMVGAIE